MKFFELFIHFNSFIYLRGFLNLSNLDREKKSLRRDKFMFCRYLPSPLPPFSPSCSPLRFLSSVQFFSEFDFAFDFIQPRYFWVKHGRNFLPAKIKTKINTRIPTCNTCKYSRQKKMSIRLCVYTRVVATLLKALTLKVLLRPMTGKE